MTPHGFVLVDRFIPFRFFVGVCVVVVDAAVVVGAAFSFF